MTQRERLAERSFLAYLLQDYIVPSVVSCFSPEDFADPRHGKLFTDYQAWTAGTSVSGYIEFATAHKEHFDLVFDICQSPEVSSKAAFPLFADTVIERAIARAFAVTDSLPGLTRLRELKERLEALERVVPEREENGHDSFLEFISAESGAVVYSGIKSFDALTGGFEVGSNNLIAASTGSGKTSLLIDLVLRFARQQKRTEILSLEMTASQLRRRFVANLTGVSIESIRARNFSEQTKERLVEASEMISSLGIQITNAAGADADRIAERIIRSDAEIIAIDYVGLISGKGSNRVELVTNASSRIAQALASSGKIGLVAAQLNRQSQHENRPPALHDLRDSGALEQDAHSVTFLHPVSPEQRKLSTRRVQAIVAKNRDGRSGEFVELDFHAAISRFSETLLQMPRVHEPVPFNFNENENDINF